MESVRKYLSKLELGKVTVYRNLTMFAVEGTLDETLDYLTLADAIKVGGGLDVDGHLIHLAAFATDSESENGRADSGNMARMRSRRRSYGRR